MPNPAGISETNAKKKRPRLDEAIEQHQAKPKKPMSSPKVEAVEVDLTKPIIPKDGGRVSQTKRDLPENSPKTKVAVNNMAILTSTEEGMKGGDTSQTSANKKEPPPEPRNSLPLPVITNNEANGSSSSSSDSSDSSSSSSDSDSEEEDGADDDEAGKEKSAFEENDEASKLPNSLTPPTLAAIEQIKKAAVSSDKQGKCRFFSPEINRLLLA